MTKTINDINDPRLVKALAHPLRVSILQALKGRTASPSQLAEELGVPLPNLSYHIRMLVQLDLLKLVTTRPRRGAIEHYYRAKDLPVLTKGAWGEVPALIKESMVARTLRDTGELVDQAAAHGGFNDEQAILSQNTLRLDREAWKRLAARAQEVHDEAQRLADEAEERGGDLIDVGLVLMTFEVDQ